MTPSLTMIANRVARQLEREDRFFDEADLFGAPSESGRDVSRSVNAAIDTILADAGMSRDEFIESLRKHTSERWVWQQGFTRLYDRAS